MFFFTWTFLYDFFKDNPTTDMENNDDPSNNNPISTSSSNSDGGVMEELWFQVVLFVVGVLLCSVIHFLCTRSLHLQKTKKLR